MDDAADRPIGNAPGPNMAWVPGIGWCNRPGFPIPTPIPVLRTVRRYDGHLFAIRYQDREIVAGVWTTPTGYTMPYAERAQSRREGYWTEVL